MEQLNRHALRCARSARGRLPGVLCGRHRRPERRGHLPVRRASRHTSAFSHPNAGRVWVLPCPYLTSTSFPSRHYLVTHSGCLSSSPGTFVTWSFPFKVSLKKKKKSRQSTQT